MTKIKPVERNIAALQRHCLQEANRSLTEGNAYPGHKETHFADAQDNFFVPMGPGARNKYGEGAGKELRTSNGKPAKMSALYSSSAMTYNLFGNDPAVITTNDIGLPEGQYEVEYEYKAFTLYRPPQAHLDVRMTSNDVVIFGEMKMVEWLRDNPGPISRTYRQPEQHRCKGKARDIFCKTAIDTLTEAMQKSATHNTISDTRFEPYTFERYDAWQMYKHALGIFNSLAKWDEKPKDVILLNVVFEPPLPEYKDATEIEHSEFTLFEQAMREAGVPDLFREIYSSEFRIQYVSVRDFVCALDLTPDHRQYLKRYTLVDV